MKVAIISFSFFESSIPLAKHLAVEEEVTLYCLFSKNHLNPPILDIKDRVGQASGVLDERQSRGLLPSSVTAYLGDSTLKLQLVVNANGLYDYFTVKNLAKILKRSKYDIIHFIGHHISFYQLHLSVKRTKGIVHTIHEGNINRLREGNWMKNFLVKRLYSYLGSSDVHLIFHSQTVKEDFLISNSCVKEDDTRVIPFGLFEIYRYIKPSDNFNINQDRFVFLFFGYILPYKGVDLLLEAASVIETSSNKQVSFIIAGKDGIGLQMDRIPTNVEIVDRFLGEAEIVELIKKSDCIIMPYRSISQSGIPNVSYCFAKPILASNLEVMKSLIQDNTNGFLFETGVVNNLVEKILSISGNLETFENVKSSLLNGYTNILDWNVITDKTLNFYTQILKIKS